MPYAIRHITRYWYSSPIQENVMEVRMQPLTEGPQRCFSFSLEAEPRASIAHYQEHTGNTVHFFNIPGQHTVLTLRAEALVDIQPFPDLPPRVPLSMWDDLDHLGDAGTFWDYMHASRFTPYTALLADFRKTVDVDRQTDPLTLLRALNTHIYQFFDYAPQSTSVDSPIDDALSSRRGVCQDYAHILIALVRHIGIPCRYVSGYLFHRVEQADRSAEDATHAWVEAYLPDLGWIGLDPTNNLLAQERHIRVAVGRDYADVPPTRGVYKGDAEEELSVGVRVSLAEAPREPDDVILPPAETMPLELQDAQAAMQSQQ